MNPLSILLLVLAAQFFSPSASAQATCAGNGAGEPGCAGAGNPINVITGNKFQREVDLAPLPGVMGLEIVRYYNSSLSGLNSRTGILGRGWRLSYETTIAAIGDTVQVLQADGTRLIFARDLLRPSLCSSSDPANGEIDVRRTAKGDEFVWRKRDGQRLSFNHQGRLVQILAPTGEFVSMQHDARGWLVKVTDPQGRSLRLDYLDKKQAASGIRFAGVQGIDSPLGRFTYAYGSAMPEGARMEDRRQLLANLVDVGMPDGARRHYHYEDGTYPTLLTGISVGRIGDDGKDVLRRYATFGYDGNGDAVRSTRAGDIGAVRLDSATGGKTILTNSVGQKTEYRYGLAAGQFRLQEVRGAGCATCSPANVRYGYDALGRLTETSQLDARGAPTETIRKELDGLGRVSRVSRIIYRDGKPGPAVMQARYEYDGSGSQPVLVSRPSVVAGKEAQTRTRYNSAGQPLAVTDTGWAPGVGGRQPVQLERTTHYRYTMIDGRSVLAQTDGPLANGRTGTPSDSDITEFVYAPRGQANGLSGLVSRVTAPGGRTTVILARNAAGLPTRIRTADAIELAFDYDSMGRVVRRTSGGISDQLSYDELGQLASVRRATGQTVFYSYAADGRVSDIYDQQNNRIKLIRNSEGELIARHLLNPDGSLAQRAAATDVDDPEEPAHVTRRTAAGGALPVPGDGGATLALQADGIAATLQGPGTVTARFKVDHAGRLTGFTDARGLESKHLHDDFGRLVGVISPDSGITVFDYDAADRLASRTSAFGSTAAATVTYRYDGAGRAIEQRTAEGLTTIRYGGAGKPERIAYPGGEERYAYDSMGRLLAHSRILDGHALVTRYRYDANGNLSEKTLPDGQVLLYTYHGPMHPKAGLLSRIARRDLLGETVLLEGLNDAEDGFARQRYRLAHGVDYLRELDVDGRITRIGSPRIWEERHQRSANGQLLSRRAGNAGTAYVYDAGGRLSGIGSMDGSGDRIGYAYDDGGNVLARVSGRDRMHFRIGAAGNRIESVHSESEETVYAYNAAGSIVRSGSTEYGWDSQQRLVEVKRHGERVAEYAYNVHGERIRKVVYANNQKKLTYYLYDGAQLVAEAEPNEGGIAITRQYVWIEDQGGARPIALLQAKSSDISMMSKTLAAVGRANARAEVYAVIVDQTGAPRALADEHGVAVWRAGVTGFGEAVLGADNLLSFNLRGSNQYFDAESGLHYNTRRYFDPLSGRYHSVDPLGLTGGSNPYIFAENNPIDRVDPLGLQSKPVQPISGWTLEDKLRYVLLHASTKLPGELGNTLKDLASPESIATTAAIFAIWTGAQFTPYGLAADVAVMGLGALFLGSEVWDVAKALYRMSSLIAGARCQGDLQEAGNIFAKGMSEIIVAAGTTAAGASAAKLGKLLKAAFNKKVDKAALVAKLNISRYGVFVDKRTRSGSVENAEFNLRRPDDYPPWSATKPVTDRWLEKGEKFYMVMGDGGDLGGWATPKRYTSIAEARRELSLLNEFTEKKGTLILQEFTVTSPIPVREGVAGPLTSKSNRSESYPGGGTQYEMLVDLRGDKYESYLEKGAKVILWQFTD